MVKACFFLSISILDNLSSRLDSKDYFPFVIVLMWFKSFI